jgi:diguanylate cyclase (GGDEF)-like protein
MNSERVKELEEHLLEAKGLDRIDALNTLAWEYGLEAPDRAIQAAQRALELSRSSDAPENFYEKGAALSLRTQGCLALMRSDYDGALTMLLKARFMLEHLPGAECRAALGNALSYLGWIFFNHGDLPLAIETLQTAQQIAQEIGNCSLEAEILNSLGAIYNESHDSHDLELAVAILQRSLALLEGSDALRTHAMTHNNLAMAQFKLQDYNSALENAAESLALARRPGLLDQQAVFLDTTGQIYLAMGEYVQAEAIFQQALDLYQEFGPDLEEYILSLARALFGQGRLNEAAQRLQQSLDTVEARGVNRLGYQFHELLSAIYEAQGDFPRAIAHYKRFDEIKTQVFDEITGRRLSILEIQHQIETEHQDTEILVREVAASRQDTAELEIQATTNPITGLFNRRHLITLGNYILKASRRSGRPLAVLEMGIDHFENFNTAEGRQAGDQALAEIGAIIRSGLRSGDLLCYCNDKEFAAVLPECLLPEAQQAAQRIATQAAAHLAQTGAQPTQVTLSIGAAQSRPEEVDLEDVLGRASRALQAAQAAGGNQVSVYPG